MILKLQPMLNRFKFQLLLVFILSIFFIVLELKTPYYFLQDDNQNENLPLYIHNYESLGNGELALYNFHQSLGTPALAAGLNATLHPIGYVAVFFSKILFHHYDAAIDLMVAFLLIVGAIGFYHLLRHFGLDESSSFF